MSDKQKETEYGGYSLKSKLQFSKKKSMCSPLIIYHNVISAMNLPLTMKLWNNEKHIVAEDYDLSNSVHLGSIKSKAKCTLCALLTVQE